MIWAILISLLAGGLATSLAEYFLNYNLVDKILDLFAKGETAVINEAGKVKKAL